MPLARKQNYITGYQSPRIKILLLGVIEVNPDFPFFYDQYFLGKRNFPCNNLVDVRINQGAFLVRYEPHLLRKVFWGKKLHSICPKTSMDNDSNKAFFCFDSFLYLCYLLFCFSFSNQVSFSFFLYLFLSFFQVLSCLSLSWF